MKPIEYLFLQMELEGIHRTADHLIARLTPEVEDFPLALMACTADGDILMCYDESLPSELRARLRLCDLQSFHTQELIEIFGETGIPAKKGTFMTYIFPGAFASRFVDSVQCYEPGDPRLVDIGFQGFERPVYGVEREGRVVSACVSVRQNARCGEAWILTDPDFRRQGLAQQAVTAWAGALLREEITPLYSHKFSNTASSLLAQSLDLIHVYDETVIAKA